MAPFDRSHTNSYSYSIAIMVIYCIVFSKINRYISRKSHFSYPFSTYQLGCEYFCAVFITIKPDLCSVRYTVNRFRKVPVYSQLKCVTGGETDGQTDRRRSDLNTGKYGVAHGKNRPVSMSGLKRASRRPLGFDAKHRRLLFVVEKSSIR